MSRKQRPRRLAEQKAKDRTKRRARLTAPSYAEARIIEFLRGENIKFEREYSHPDLHNYSKQPLFMDFYIPFYGMFIEFDGEHHRSAVYGEEQLIRQETNDRRKNAFALGNRFFLLRLTFADLWHLRKIMPLAFSMATENYNRHRIKVFDKANRRPKMTADELRFLRQVASTETPIWLRQIRETY